MNLSIWLWEGAAVDAEHYDEDNDKDVLDDDEDDNDGVNFVTVPKFVQVSESLKWIRKQVPPPYVRFEIVR